MTSPPDLIGATVRWQSALLDSASTDVIGVSSWWDRAGTAIATAAAGADSFSHAVSIACRKLQIDTLSQESAAEMARLEPIISGAFPEWCELVSRDAVYITALTRVERTSRRKPKPTEETVS